MIKISDRKEINRALDQLKLNSRFSTEGLQFEIRIYEKGEQVVSPLTPMQHFMFVLSGTIRIYELDEDSTLHSIVTVNPGEIMGYNEFCFENDNYTVYAEALTRSRCLVLPYRQPKRSLRSDCDFLYFLLQSSLSDQIRNSKITHLHSELEEKVLFYIENLCPDQTLKSVNDTVAALHCSRRQLQRVLRKLCESGVLKHEKKGCYKRKED